jgi:hypothetical protein
MGNEKNTKFIAVLASRKFQIIEIAITIFHSKPTQHHEGICKWQKYFHLPANLSP